MSDERKVSGGCMCGAIRYEVPESPLGIGICHCRTCQQQTGSAFWVGVRFPGEDVHWTAGEPAYYESSDHMHRGFCPDCGSAICYRFLESPYPGFTNSISLAIGTFDDPHRWKPEFHFAEENQLEWTKFEDGLERMRIDELPPGDEMVQAARDRTK